MKYFSLILAILLVFACEDDNQVMLDENNLAEYIQANNNLALDELIACAGGKPGGLFVGDTETTSVIYYPIEGAREIRYFETASVLDSTDFTQYTAKELGSEALFNGYLAKFNNPDFEGERQGIVTFITDGTLHISNPITIKSNSKPTEINPSLLEIIPNNTNPSFEWEDGIFDENAIYFHVVSDLDGNLISGTYTFEKNFTFYELDNVVLNITDPNTNPSLSPNTTYNFTLMGVSLDNWVNLLIEEEFSTP